MSQPIASVVKVASTTQEAKVLVALLQAEGIPAHIEGDSLADEVAVSRRLINLNGTRVMVPTASLEQAREVLANMKVDDDELEQQALGADHPESPVPPPAPPAPPKRWPVVVTTLAAALFLVLWLTAIDASATSRHPTLRYEPTTSGMREVRIADGKLLREYEDADHNGTYERVVTFGKAATSTSFDADDDGIFERHEERHADGNRVIWSDLDADGIVDQCTVVDRQGTELQRLVVQPQGRLELQAR
jgi:hypothetical protein